MAGLSLVVATVIYWPKEAAAAAISRSGRDGGTNVVAQESKGANSPNIVGNNNVVNIAPTRKSTPARGRLKVEDRVSKDTPRGITESVIFGNTGSRDTYLVAIQILDSQERVVAAYRKGTGRVRPELPVTIKPGNPKTLAVQLTKGEASRAHWMAYQSENNQWRRIPWNRGLHYLEVDLGDAVQVSAEVDVKVTRAPSSRGAGGGGPDAK